MSENSPLPLDSTEDMQTKPDAILDLRGIQCPINFVRTKLQLGRMEAGALLEVWLDPGEPVAQVPDSLKMEGYEVDRLMDEGTYYALQVRNPLS